MAFIFPYLMLGSYMVNYGFSNQWGAFGTFMLHTTVTLVNYINSVEIFAWQRYQQQEALLALCQELLIYMNMRQLEEEFGLSLAPASAPNLPIPISHRPPAQLVPQPPPEHLIPPDRSLRPLQPMHPHRASHSPRRAKSPHATRSPRPVGHTHPPSACPIPSPNPEAPAPLLSQPIQSSPHVQSPRPREPSQLPRSNMQEDPVHPVDLRQQQEVEGLHELGTGAPAIGVSSPTNQRDKQGPEAARRESAGPSSDSSGGTRERGPEEVHETGEEVKRVLGEHGSDELARFLPSRDNLKTIEEVESKVEGSGSGLMVDLEVDNVEEVDEGVEENMNDMMQKYNSPDARILPK